MMKPLARRDEISQPHVFHVVVSLCATTNAVESGPTSTAASYQPFASKLTDGCDGTNFPAIDGVDCTAS